MIMQYAPFVIPTAIFSFWMITFLESAMSKAMDIKGNVEYFKSQFAKSIISPVVTPSFYFILLLELSAGLLSLATLATLFFDLKLFFKLGILSLALTTFTVICLFAGQRLAKDYGGASGIVGYFIVCLFGLMAIYGK